MNWLKQLIKDINDNSKRNNFQRYCRQVDEYSKNKQRDYFGNFSKDGFIYIFKTILQNAYNNIIICCNNYDIFFNDDLYIMLELAIRKNIKITLITTNGEVDERFVKIKNQNFNYYAVKAKINNFILSDFNVYWIDHNDKNERKSMQQFFYAAVCFNDSLQVEQLTRLVNEMIKVAETPENKNIVNDNLSTQEMMEELIKLYDDKYSWKVEYIDHCCNVSFGSQKEKEYLDEDHYLQAEWVWQELCVDESGNATQDFNSQKNYICFEKTDKIYDGVKLIYDNVLKRRGK